MAVFASKTTGAHDGVDVAALTPDRVDRLKAVFWDMCVITSEVETIDHPGEGEDEGWTEYILHITITAKTAEEMRTEYAFTSYQNEALTELLAELEPMGLLLTDLSVSQERARPCSTATVRRSPGRMHYPATLCFIPTMNTLASWEAGTRMVSC